MKKSILLLTLLSLQACQTNPAFTKVDIEAPRPHANQSIAMLSTLRSIDVQDLRSDYVLARFTHNRIHRTLESSKPLSQVVMQSVQEKLTNQGIQVNSMASNTDLRININDFNANVMQSPLKSTVSSTAKITVHIKGQYSELNKVFSASNQQEYALNVSDDKITQLLNQTLADVVTQFYNDQEIANAIRNIK